MPDTSTPSAVQSQLMTAAEDTMKDNIAAAASNSSVDLADVRVGSIAAPAAQGSTTAVVTSSLTFTGLGQGDAMSAEAEIAAGIASSLPGVEADKVRITGYATAADGSLVVSFEVRSPAAEVRL